MELKLNGDEVKAILLQHAQTKYPGEFDTVRGAHYESIPSVVFTKEALPPVEAPPKSDA